MRGGVVPYRIQWILSITFSMNCNLICKLQRDVQWLTHTHTLQDLKKFHYYYWFAFPAPSQPTVHVTSKSALITTVFNNKQLEGIAESYKALDSTQKIFFAITKQNDSCNVQPLANILKQTEVSSPLDTTNTYFVFQDSSNGSNPGWPLRIFMAALIDCYPYLAGTKINVIGLRSNVTGGISNSRVFSIKIPQVSAKWFHL